MHPPGGGNVEMSSIGEWRASPHAVSVAMLALGPPVAKSFTMPLAYRAIIPIF